MKKKRKIAHSHNMKMGILDNDYSLFEDGEVLREYDKHIYPGGHNLKETMKANKVSNQIKDDFINSASPEDIKLVKRLIGR